MTKIKYRFNPDSISYEKIETGFKGWLLNCLKYIASGLVLAVLIVVALFYFFDSPKEKALVRENQQILSQYMLMNKELDQIKKVLADLEQRDDNIYRVIFEADPIPATIRTAGFGGINRYTKFENLDDSELVISTAKKLDNLVKSMYIQTKSYDDVEEMVKNKFKMLASIPAIVPIAIKDFGRISAGFGVRMHPIYKTRKFHYGMDFTGPIGTPVYATGDGVVKRVKYTRGYGKQIIIDHGYGYTTMYAHLDDYKVKVGKKVKRGEVIGYLGNTGKSTGPHLHYEVKKNRKCVNPIHYYFNDLTASEYDRMVEFAANTGQSLD